MTDTGRVRVLLVLNQLVQHGSERYLFEICQALDPRRFQVEVLTRKAFVRGHYYYAKLRALGIPVHCRLISRRYLTYPIRKPYFRWPWLRRAVDAVHGRMTRLEFGAWFDGYDLVASIGIETYCDCLQPVLAGSPKVVIHHVSHQYQFERDYFAECDQRRVVILDRLQARELAASAMSDARTFEFPLCMALPADNRYTLPPPAEGPPCIAYVSRLYADRPNEPVFRCFAALLKRTAATLLVYGSGKPELYAGLLDELQIRSRVRFMGHQSDIDAALRRDRVSLVWLTSMGATLGYASIEVAALGVPMAFWNISPDAEDSYERVLADTGGAIHSFRDAAALVAFTMALLADPARLRESGARLRAFILARHDIANHIPALEAYYAAVAGVARAS